MRSDVTNIGHQVIQKAFKNCPPFIKCISKNDGKGAEDLDLVMPM